jgi:hypothetical protein
LNNPEQVYFVNASAETHIVNSIKFRSHYFGDVVKGNLHNEQVILVI